MSPRTAFAALPTLVLTVAFAAICWHFGTLWPFPLVVHEDGNHTLWGTIFFFEHAAQELPVDILLAGGIAGAMLRAGAAARDRTGLIRKLLPLALALDSAILAGACAQAGTARAVQWLLQYHTRDGVPLAFGSHWGYHLLSLAALLLLGMALASMAGQGQGRATLLAGSWLVFGAVSVALIRSATPFVDARYLGHQMRETLTHALVSVPLALAACCAVSGTGRWWKRPSSRTLWPAIGFVALSVWLAAGSVLKGAGGQAQTSDPVKLICSHFFEHTFSYLVIPVHAVLFLAIAVRRPS